MPSSFLTIKPGYWSTRSGVSRRGHAACLWWSASASYARISEPRAQAPANAKHFTAPSSPLTTSELGLALNRVNRRYSLCSVLFIARYGMAIQAGNYRRFLLTLGSLTDLGPMLAGERNFQRTADAMLHAMMETAGVREGVLFTFSEKPPQLSAVAWSGMALFPQAGYIPLLARQVQALA